MKVLVEIRNEMDLDEIASAELNSWNKLLPPRWGDLSLVGHEDAVAAWMKSTMRREIQVESEEVLLARKLGRGGRPISLLGLKERLLYRGAISLIEADTGAPDRSARAFDEFQRAPLRLAGCKYVLKADIASYYQYIDHERLVDEVVAQTGNDLAVTAAVELLRAANSRSFGIPQLSSVSDVLAEIYIDPMRRDLVRSGHRVWRFADDFRVASSSYFEVLRALEDADHAARGLGLVLNEMKTYTWGRDRYEASLTAARDRERELFESLDLEELDEPNGGGYDENLVDDFIDTESLLQDSEIEFEDAEIGAGPEPQDDEPVSESQLAAASKVLDLWISEEEEHDVQIAEPAKITAKLLGRALRVLALGGDASALDSVTAMLVYEPSLTPTITGYVRSMIQYEEQAVSDVLDDVCQSHIVSAWQAIWMAFIAGELSSDIGRSAHTTWLRDQLQSPQASLRAEALLALSRRHLITRVKALEELNGLPSMHRATGLLAVVALGDSRSARGVADSELDKLRIEWGQRRLAR
jgi:hypothetical protein